MPPGYVRQSWYVLAATACNSLFILQFLPVGRRVPVAAWKRFTCSSPCAASSGASASCSIGIPVSAGGRTASRSTRRPRPWPGGAWRGYPAGEKMNATTTTTPMAIKRLVSMVGLFGFAGSIGGR